MQVEIEAAPAYAFGRITVSPGRGVKVEAGAMASMTGDVQIETKATGGLMGGLKRSMLGGESFFVNTFGPRQAGTSPWRPSCPATCGCCPWKAEPGSSSPARGSRPTRKWTSTRSGAARRRSSGARACSLLRCSGQGDVLVSSYGAIASVDVPAGQSYVIDTGHVVAFQEGMQYGVEKAGSWKSTIFGAEGLVVRFQGPGAVWLQTRGPPGSRRVAEDPDARPAQLI